MRTTITLDSDVAERIRQRMRETDKSFKETVNELIRKGLAFGSAPPRKPFRVKTRGLGLKPGLSLDNVEELLDQVEGPARP
ncbi:MAG: hypothetical protein HY319_30705 [Armatimonadetes bacterium]|nr:hypothetical protein [Armatimonadota bacterium]